MDQNANNIGEHNTAISPEKENVNEGDQDKSKHFVNDDKESSVGSEVQSAEVEVAGARSGDKQDELVDRTEDEEIKIPLPPESTESDTQKLLLEINDTIKRKVAYDETKEKMFNALYEQLKGYQGEFLDAYQKPLIKNLLGLYDDMIEFEKIIDQESCSEKVNNGIVAIKIELLEILDNMEVVCFQEHSKILDRRLQKAIRVIETSDPEEDKKVVEFLKEGFFWKGNIFRPEEVVIKKHVSAENQQKEA